jgi:hypothetical protein
MDLAEPCAPGAIRLAGCQTPGSDRASDRHQAARTDWTRLLMTARTAGTRDDDLDQPRNREALPHRRLRTLDEGPAPGTAIPSTPKS